MSHFAGMMALTDCLLRKRVAPDGVQGARAMIPGADVR